MIKLSKEQHNHLVSIVGNNHKLRDRILNVTSFLEDDYEYDMDDELEIDLYDFLQDEQLRVGYDENYKPNEDWEKIQVLMDEVYDQSN